MLLLCLQAVRAWLAGSASMAREAEMFAEIYRDIMMWLYRGSLACGKANWLLENLQVEATLN